MHIADFETDRLFVRSWTPRLADGKLRTALEQSLGQVLTENVLRPLPEPLQLHGAIATWVDERAAESDVRLVLDKADDALLGLLILAHVNPEETPPDVHIGYLFAEHAWGQGYASELVSGLVASAKAKSPSRLLGGVATSNPASARVLLKAGFERDQALSTAETDMFLCDLT